jgi:hypothetical protein
MFFCAIVNPVPKRLAVTGYADVPAEHCVICRQRALRYTRLCPESERISRLANAAALQTPATPLATDLLNQIPPVVQLALRAEERLQLQAAHFQLFIERRILLEARY